MADKQLTFKKPTSARLYKVDPTDKRRINQLKADGFQEVKFDKKGKAIAIENGMTAAELEKENKALRKKIEELEAAK